MREDKDSENFAKYFHTRQTSINILMHTDHGSIPFPPAKWGSFLPAWSFLLGGGDHLPAWPFPPERGVILTPMFFPVEGGGIPTLPGADGAGGVPWQSWVGAGVEGSLPASVHHGIVAMPALNQKCTFVTTRTIWINRGKKQFNIIFFESINNESCQAAVNNAW